MTNHELMVGLEALGVGCAVVAGIFTVALVGGWLLGDRIDAALASLPDDEPVPYEPTYDEQQWDELQRRVDGHTHEPRCDHAGCEEARRDAVSRIRARVAALGRVQWTEADERRFREFARTHGGTR